MRRDFVQRRCKVWRRRDEDSATGLPAPLGAGYACYGPHALSVRAEISDVAPRLWTHGRDPRETERNRLRNFEWRFKRGAAEIGNLEADVNDQKCHNHGTEPLMTNSRE